MIETLRIKNKIAGANYVVCVVVINAMRNKNKKGICVVQELVKGISKLPDRRLEADRPRHSIQFINDQLVEDRISKRFSGRGKTKALHPIGRAGRLLLEG
ncbi:hypothetical protein TNCV_759481 [Trichonephila clavipes]|nr:hypothetical protein TNCV_759481 [Trichonephila clavipes]